MGATCRCISLANLKRVCVRANLQLQANYDVGIYTEWQNVMNRKSATCRTDEGTLGGATVAPPAGRPAASIQSLLPAKQTASENSPFVISSPLSTKHVYTHLMCFSSTRATCCSQIISFYTFSTSCFCFVLFFL